MTATMEEHAAAHRASSAERTRCMALGYAWAKSDSGDRRFADEVDIAWFADQVVAAGVTWGQVRRLYDELAERRYAERRAAELAAELRS